MTPGRKYTLGSVGRVLWSGSLILIICTVIGGGAAAWYVSGIASSYQSSATILVLQQVVPQNMVRSTITQDLDERLRTLSDRVLAPARLGSIASELNVYPELGSDVAAASQRLRSRTSVALLRSDAFRVTFVHRNPVMAMRVAERLSKTFVEENLSERTGQAEETERFLDDQLQRTRDRLTEHEAKLEEYRRTYAGQLPTQLTSNLQVIQNGQVQLRALAESIKEERDQKMRIEQLLAALPTGDAPRTPAAAPRTATAQPEFDPFVDEATELRGREALQALPRVRATLRSLELQLKPEHPDVVRVKRIISELERRVAADPDSASPATDGSDAAAAASRARQLRADLAAVERRLAAREQEEAQLRAQMSRYQQRVELTPTRETELTTLMRDYDSLRENYRTLLAKKEESQMASELERRSVGESMRIVEAARVPDAPASPNRRQTTGTGLLAGLALGVLLIGWREIQDPALRTEAEVLSSLDVPVIGLIPVIPGQMREKQARLRRAVLVGSAACLLVVVALLAYFRSGLGL